MNTVEKIIQETIQSKLDSKKKLLDEALVHEQKPYENRSKFVSDKTKDTHKELYDDYVKCFNKCSAELDGINRDYSPETVQQYRRAKKDEQRAGNAIFLHELFFANSFVNESEILSDSLTFIMLQREWGTFDEWQQDFIQCAMASNGWAVCGYSFFYKKFVNVLIDDHTQHALVGLYPLIVVDVWEHASRDYKPSQKKDYVYRIMGELDWEIIESRFNKLENILKADK